MGILAENLVWLLKHAIAPGKMLELGNQFLYICAKPFPSYPDRYLNHSMADPIAAKPYLVELGFEHTSVDLNGRDGALTLDLATPIDLGAKFHFITDFGTSEHVSDLWQCLRNLHEHSEVGTLFFHVNPLTGNWPGHGNWYRDRAFYEEFCRLTGYQLLDYAETASCGNFKDGWTCWALMKRTPESTFPTREQFSTLPLKTV